MVIDKNPWTRIRKQLEIHEVCLVRHPGFWRSNSTKKLIIYLRSPNLILPDLRQLISTGGLGAWEGNKESRAYVRRKFRKKYFCGGTWFGRREAIRGLLEKLSSSTEEDLKHGCIAVWHDESHLNCWASENKFGEESPEMCFDETYPQLRGLTPYITAVRKTLKTR